MMIEISEKANVLVDEVLRQVEIKRSKNEVSSYFYARMELDNYIATLEAENARLKEAARLIPMTERKPEEHQEEQVFCRHILQRLLGEQVERNRSKGNL